MKKIILLAAMMLIASALFAGKINIVCSDPDMGDIMKNIAGDRANVESLMMGTQDPHSVEPRPSMVVKVRNADLVAVIGMDLDMWANSVIEASRNSHVMKGGDGYLDLSKKIPVIEIPQGKVDASIGDVHIYGNPHYHMDPNNGKIIAKEILEKLSEKYPDDADYFKGNYDAFIKKLDEGIARWNAELKPYKGLPIAATHDCWDYFINYCGFKVSGYIESKPAIPPSPGDIERLIKKMKEDGAKIILVDQFYDMSAPEKVAKETGAKIVLLSTAVGGLKGTDTYIGLFNYDVDTFVNALK
jgi:ABC-type Zn uptake system ZnuABC Zn-binding protein ZnuA